MFIKRPANATRVLGEEQGFLALPVHDAITFDRQTGKNYPVMITVWEPTPAELEALNKGACVQVQITGREHPPIVVFVNTEEKIDG